jgi:Tol biopolymer transport system component
MFGMANRLFQWTRILGAALKMQYGNQPTNQPDRMNIREIRCLQVAVWAGIVILTIPNTMPSHTRDIAPTPTSTAAKQGKIAFVSDRDGNYEIYVMNADGSDQHNLSNNKASDGAPVWSPDGKQIAFVSNRDGNDDIYVMNADGSDQHNLTQNETFNSVSAWSPDGKQIAFASRRGRNDEMYVMNADGSDQRKLVNIPGENPQWSPDGKQIVFESASDGSWEIYFINSDGSDARRLTQGGDNRSPAWSPDGKQITFISHRDGNYEIYVMNADGSNPRRLTNNLDYDEYPAWSPDGKFLAFRRGSPGGEGGDSYYNVFVMGPDGKNQRRIVNPNDQPFQYNFSWSPDSKSIVLGSSIGASYEIFSVEIFKRKVSRLTVNKVQDEAPVWQP